MSCTKSGSAYVVWTNRVRSDEVSCVCVSVTLCCTVRKVGVRM